MDWNTWLFTVLIVAGGVVAVIELWNIYFYMVPTSGMCYSKWLFFSKHEPSMSLGQRTGATVNDLRKVNAMYNCNGAASTPNAGDYRGSEYHIF